MIAPGEEAFLLCAPASSEILSINIPDSGRALAKATLTFKNNNSAQTYYWAAQISVGAPQIYGAVGDDVCPGTYSTRTILGYGTLSASNSKVSVTGWQGSSPCSNQQIGVFSGGSLDVWVEDPDPACTGKDVQLVSSDSVIGTGYWDWTTSMVKYLSLSVPKADNRTSILVMSSTEGSPQQDPNRICGQEAATLVAQVAADSLGVLATEVTPIPASQGMGHLVLAPSQTASYNQSLTSVSLWLGSNTSATAIKTGGCCGDAKLGYVRW